jgi:hypothetical protein
MTEDKKLDADKYLFEEDTKPVFRSMIVEGKIINDNIQKN